MIKKLGFILLPVCLGITLLFTQCSPKLNFEKDRSSFEAAKVVDRYKAVSDMNDYYFELKENGFFDFYRQLFDSVKNTSYPGKYVLKNDTLQLSFYNKKGKDILGTKAIINNSKKEIVFFDHTPAGKKRLIFN